MVIISSPAKITIRIFLKKPRARVRSLEAGEKKKGLAPRRRQPLFIEQPDVKCSN